MASRMDGFSIFRKLIYGTHMLPRKRKKKRNKAKKTGEQTDEGPSISGANMQSDSEVHPSATSSSNQATVDLNNEGESGAIDLMANEEEEGPAQKKRKKEKKPLSLMQLTKIHREEITHFRRVHRIRIEGSDVPDPVKEFAELESDCGLNPSILANIAKLGYATPTPVQMQVIPLMIHERQALVCAPTGSGKTASFLIPVLHVLKGPQEVGFRVLIVAPTRELVKQIHADCLSLAEGTNIRPCVLNNVSAVVKQPNFCLKYDLLISTPNRLIYMLQHDPPLLSLDKVEWLIVDESDKLFETGKHGFREQLATVYKACDSAHVKRAMFSATYSYDVEQWCKSTLDSVVSVTIGDRNTSVSTVKQKLTFVGNDQGKLIEMRDIIRKGIKAPVLVFVESIVTARDLFIELIYDGLMVYAMHGSLSPAHRDRVVDAFHGGKIHVLICTDLMARGIDFQGVNLVINYDFPPDAVTYIHRIGRTGRAGREGEAITFFTEADFENIRSIAQVIKNAGCEVPEYILQMKKQKKQKFRKKKKKNSIEPPTNGSDKSSAPATENKMKNKIKKKKSLAARPGDAEGVSGAQENLPEEEKAKKKRKMRKSKKPAQKEKLQAEGSS